MFSSTLKRSVATLGVVAGVLAAAGPASASDGDHLPTEQVSFNVKGPVAGTQVGSEGVKAPSKAGTQGREFGDSGFAF